MGLFKKKVKIEEIVSVLITSTIPKALQYYHRETRRAPSPISLPDSKLIDIGGAMCLFFLAKHLPDEKPGNQEKMARAYKQLKLDILTVGGDAESARTWWKAFTDGLIFQEREERLRIACRIAWDKLAPNTAYREPSPLRSFGYFLQVEVDTVRKMKLI
ncbi:MAG: hypothetical protein KJ626_10790 [Verrucomicrobia bacterium]|nr:hypothetical protein [Verrucomicrobiota bacterium]